MSSGSAAFTQVVAANSENINAKLRAIAILQLQHPNGAPDQRER